MLIYIIRRLLISIPQLLAISAITFFLMHLVPGSPFDRLEGQRYDSAMRAQMERDFGLDKPLWQQYFYYIKNAARLNLGPSFSYPDQNVTDLIREHFPYSLRLGGQALLFALLLGLPAGLLAAVHRNTWIDYLISASTTMGFAIPTFVWCLGFIILFGSFLHIIKISPTTEDYQTQFLPWILPTFTVGLPAASIIARHTRTAIIEEMHQEYVIAARGKGANEKRVLYRHILKNAMIPIWTVIGLLAPSLITGEVITEKMFQIPGIGAFLINAVSGRDYSMIMGIVLIYSIIVISINFITDITYTLINPVISFK